jgi:GT2 family glycosyltransferase
MKSIAIIVLNWCGWRDTLACLASLQKLRVPFPITIIVCDNASLDNSYEQILNWAQQHYAPSEIGVFSPEKQEGQDILLSPFSSPLSPFPFVLIQTGANLGFAGGHNVGIRYALSQGYEYLWLLNNDTVVDAHALSTLYECATIDPQIALLGSTVIDFYQTETVQCAGGCCYFPLWTIFKPVLGGQSVNAVMQYDETISLDYVYGAALFLKADAVKKVGLLNETYFLFYEELDYAQRLKRQGYKIGWCQKSLVYHKGSASVGSVKEGNLEKLRRANYYENLSTLKYTANFYPRLLPLVMITRFVGKSLALILRRDFYLFAPLFQAYWDFIKK